MMSPFATTSPTRTSGRWLMQVFWFERWNFCRCVDIHARFASFDIAHCARITIRVASTWSTIPPRRRDRSAPQSVPRRSSIPVPTSGASALPERHGLTLHVGAHERAVRVIVLKERDERGRDGDQLLRTDTSIRSTFSRGGERVLAGLAGGDEIVRRTRPCRSASALACGNAIARSLPSPTDRRPRRSTLPPTSRLPVRTFDEAVLVDASEGRQRVDETDIRTFRCFDRTDTSVMRRMHVAHFEACTFTRQTARSKRRETPLVRDLRRAGSSGP